jgi:hypothetical protein
VEEDRAVCGGGSDTLGSCSWETADDAWEVNGKYWETSRADGPVWVLAGPAYVYSSLQQGQ